MAVSQELVAKFKADTADFNRKVSEVGQKIDKTTLSVDKLNEKENRLETTTIQLKNANSHLVEALNRNTKATEKATLRISKLNIETEKAVKQTDSFSKKTQEQSVTTTNMASIATKSSVAIASITAAIGTATIAVGAFAIKVGSDMESATKRIEAMLGSAEKANFVISSLRDAGYETGASVIDLANSYGKLATFVENGSVSLQESLDLQNGLTNTATALGASSEQLSTVMYGLSQALGSGVVRAEEFNQVTEPLPGIINKMEQATGLASGELRQMINDGLITSDMFKKILIPALQSFETQSQQMAGTLKVQAGIMSNTFVSIGEDIYAYLEAPLASATIAANRFLQAFLSVKRASADEVQNRLNDIIAQKSALAFRASISPEKKQELDALTVQENELIAELQSRNNQPESAIINTKNAVIDTELQEEIARLRQQLKSGNKSSGKVRASRATKIKLPKLEKQKDSDPLFKEEIRDYREDLGNFSVDAVREFDLVETMFGDMKDSIISGFVTMSSSGKASFKEMARSMIADIQSIITRTLLMKAIAGIGNAIGGYFAPAGMPVSTGGTGVGFGSNGSVGFLSGARANGGAVNSNRSYLVGERGPEILTMGSGNGYVHSNEKSFGGSGSMVVNIDARGASNGVEQDIRRVMNEVMTLKKQVPNMAISAVREQNSRNSGFLR